MKIELLLIFYVGLLTIWLILDEIKLYKFEVENKVLSGKISLLTRSFKDYKKVATEAATEVEDRVTHIEDVIEVITDERTSPYYSG